MNRSTYPLLFVAAVMFPAMRTSLSIGYGVHCRLTFPRYARIAVTSETWSTVSTTTLSPALISEHDLTMRRPATGIGVEVLPKSTVTVEPDTNLTLPMRRLTYELISGDLIPRFTLRPR